MVTPPRIALLALITMLAGCGSQLTGHDPRRQVAAYLTRVNRAEHALSKPLSDVSRVGARIAGGHGTGMSLTASASAAARLQGDLRDIRSLGRRLAAIPAPASASGLRGMLVALTAQQASLTRQTAQLAIFLPRFGRALAPLAPSSRRLEAVLTQAPGAVAVAGVISQRAAALRAFRATLQQILTHLSKLYPPPVSQADYRAQIASLRGMSFSAGVLAAALLSGDSAAVPALLSSFDRAAAAPQSMRVLHAQAVAARAYDREVAHLRVLGANAVQERLRLQYSLR